MPKLTELMIWEGIKNGAVTVGPDPNGDGVYEPVCFIGDFWFYFAGSEAETMTVEEYAKATPVNVIVKNITESANALWSAERDYYYACVKSFNMAKKGLENGAIRFTKSPDEETAVLCHIDNVTVKLTPTSAEGSTDYAKRLIVAIDMLHGGADVRLLDGTDEKSNALAEMLVKNAAEALATFPTDESIQYCYDTIEDYEKVIKKPGFVYVSVSRANMQPSVVFAETEKEAWEAVEREIVELTDFGSLDEVKKEAENGKDVAHPICGIMKNSVWVINRDGDMLKWKIERIPDVLYEKNVRIGHHSKRRS